MDAKYEVETVEEGDDGEFVKEPKDRIPFNNNAEDPRVIDPSDLIGRTYLDSDNDDGTKSRMKIVELIKGRQEERDSRSDLQSI